MKKLTCFFAFLGMLTSLWAQSGSVSGTITDTDGNGLAGANVVLDGTSLGTASDANGSYSISNVPFGSYTITASYIGHESASQAVHVGDAAVTVNFELAAEAIAMGGVMVTGSRAAGRTAMKSPTPIDGFDDMTLRRQGNGDFTETLKNQVPSFNATPLTGDGAAFVRPTSLRGLPPDNILVLVNSKRRHRSALISHFGAAMNVGAHAVDVGMIPGIALKRLEVLRDGASAQYGSDAIAGVMNFIMKERSEGIEIDAQSGMWLPAPNGRGGEFDLKVAANVGMKLTEKGFLNVSTEWINNPELSRGFQHTSASDGYKGWNAAGYTKDDTWGYTKNNPTDDTDTWQTAMNWGRPKSYGFRSAWNAGLQINDHTHAYSFGNFADTFGEYSFFLRAAGKSGALTDIPLNPADTSQGNFSWGDTYPIGFTPRLEGHGNDFSSVVGLKGDHASGVEYDFSASYGSNYLHYYLKNTLNLSWGPYSPHNFEIGDLQQAETNLNADFSYPLSDNLNLAFGGEWREEKYTMYQGQKEAWMPGPWSKVHLLTDPETGSTYTAPGLAANGMPGTSPDAAGVFKRTNYAIYGDAEMDMGPLLVQAAGRFEDFSDFGTTTNFKVAGRYSLGNLATFRGNFSTGFRAPTPGQSNYTGVVTSFDGVTGMQVQEGTLKPTDALAVSMGGAALKPESATNISVGMTTNIISNLNLTVDAYIIDVTDRIIKSRSLSVPAGSSEEFTELAFYTNNLSTNTTGLDVVAVMNLGNTNVSAAINYNKTTVTDSAQVDTDGNGTKDAWPVSSSTIFNMQNNLPKIRMSLTADHRLSQKLSAMARLNYYGETIDERGGREKVDPAMLLDLELSYVVSSNLSVILGANNVLNTYPTMITTRVSQGMPYPRRTPIGYHGGMGYVRLMYNF